jgi:hypothetical protein
MEWKCIPAVAEPIMIPDYYYRRLSEKRVPFRSLNPTRPLDLAVPTINLISSTTRATKSLCIFLICAVNWTHRGLSRSRNQVVSSPRCHQNRATSRAPCQFKIHRRVLTASLSTTDPSSPPFAGRDSALLIQPAPFLSRHLSLKTIPPYRRSHLYDGTIGKDW